MSGLLLIFYGVEDRLREKVTVFTRKKGKNEAKVREKEKMYNKGNEKSGKYNEDE